MPETLDPDTRKRARSPSPSAAAVPALVQQPCLPLTRERLALHTSLVESQTHPTTAAISMASPPSSSWNGTSTLSVFETEPCDNENKLNVYGILVYIDKALPADIHNFVATLQAGTRSGLDTAHSPNTRKVAQQQHIALRQDKQDGIDMLRDFLLFPDHAHESMLAIRAQHNLHNDFLPSDAALAEFWGPLETPRPDHLYGYRYFDDSQGPTAFSRDQERILRLDAIAFSLHFPFMTVQWKSPRETQGHYHARLQGALDGAAITTHLSQFYTNAGVSQTIVDTVHFSLTIDMRTALLYVHWQENTEGRTEYYMEKVMQIFLDEERSVAEMRAVMKKIIDNAMGPRLQKLRQAVDKVATSLLAASPQLQSNERQRSSSNVSSNTT